MSRSTRTSFYLLLAVLGTTMLLAAVPGFGQPGPVILTPPNLSAPHCQLLYYNFDLLNPGSCSQPVFALIGGPGAIDPATGFWSYQPTAADVGQPLTIRVQAACPPGDPGPVVEIELTVTNVPPTLTGCPDASLVANAGYPRMIDFDAIDSCPSTIRFRLLGATAMDGTVAIDSMTGVLTLVAANSDFGRLDMAVAVSDGYGADTCNLRFFVAPTDCLGGTTGDVNRDGRTNLSDLMTLINVLYFGMEYTSPTVFANINGDSNCRVDLADVIYLASYLMLGGPAPAACLAACEHTSPLLTGEGDTASVDLPITIPADGR